MSGKAKGSIGGITFAAWKGLPVVRRLPIPSRRLRTTQPQNRSLLGFLAREYTTLTPAQRVLWENYALNHPHPDGFGGTFILSGQNAYIMLNHTAVRGFAIGALQTDPPTDPPAASILSFTAETGATDPGDIDLTWSHAGTADAADRNEMRIAGPFQSPARQEVHSRFRHGAWIAGNLVVFTATGLVEDTWYWFLIRYTDQYGQTSAWHMKQATPKLTP